MMRGRVGGRVPETTRELPQALFTLTANPSFDVADDRSAIDKNTASPH
jgi:hypothetical protein